MAILKPRIYWPSTITGSNHTIQANDGSTTSGGTIASGDYLTPELLAAAVQTALQPRLPACTVAVTPTGHLTISWLFAFTMKGATSPTGQPLNLLGFTSADVASVANVVTSPYQMGNSWYANQAVMRDTSPIRDTAMDTVTRAVSGQTKFVSEAELTERSIHFAWMPPEKVYARFATGSYLNQALETFWQDGRARFRYWEDAATLLNPVDYVLSADAIGKFEPSRQFVKKALYEQELKFWGYVA